MVALGVPVAAAETVGLKDQGWPQRPAPVRVRFIPVSRWAMRSSDCSGMHWYCHARLGRRRLGSSEARPGRARATALRGDENGAWATSCGTTSTPSPPSTGPCSTASTGWSSRCTPTPRSYQIPTYKVGRRRLFVGVWKPGCRSTAGSRAWGETQNPRVPATAVGQVSRSDRAWKATTTAGCSRRVGTDLGVGDAFVKLPRARGRYRAEGGGS